MMDVTPFSGASQRINKETEQKEHKTLGTSSILEGTPQNHRVSEWLEWIVGSGEVRQLVVRLRLDVRCL